LFESSRHAEQEEEEKKQEEEREEEGEGGEGGQQKEEEEEEEEVKEEKTISATAMNEVDGECDRAMQASVDAVELLTPIHPCYCTRAASRSSSSSRGSGGD
jgi:hypothetical protein